MRPLGYRSWNPDINWPRARSCSRNRCWAACTTSPPFRRMPASRREHTGRWTVRGNAEPAEVRHQADRMAFLRSTVIAQAAATRTPATILPAVSWLSRWACVGTICLVSDSNARSMLLVIGQRAPLCRRREAPPTGGAARAHGLQNSTLMVILGSVGEPGKLEVFRMAPVFGRTRKIA